ncbi:MAG: hypothetical protein HEQ23_14135 [Tepidisphaera sp.]
MRRRWFAIVAWWCGLAWVFGVICTLGVAWTIALRADLSSFRGQSRTEASSWRTPSYLADVLPEPKAGREMPGRAAGFRQVATDFPVPTERGLDGGWFTIWSSEFGWPCYAVRSDSLAYRPMRPGQTSERVQAIKSAFVERVGLNAGIDVRWLAKEGKPRPLPTGVMWPGLMANSAIYGVLGGVIGLGVWVIVKGVRRWVRVRKGRCVGCGYEVGGLAKCPECGWERVVAAGGPSGRAA